MSSNAKNNITLIFLVNLETGPWAVIQILSCLHFHHEYCNTPLLLLLDQGQVRTTVWQVDYHRIIEGTWLHGYLITPPTAQPLSLSNTVLVVYLIATTKKKRLLYKASPPVNHPHEGGGWVTFKPSLSHRRPAANRLPYRFDATYFFSFRNMTDKIKILAWICRLNLEWRYTHTHAVAVLQLHRVLQADDFGRCCVHATTQTHLSYTDTAVQPGTDQRYIFGK